MFYLRVHNWIYKWRIKPMKLKYEIEIDIETEASENDVKQECLNQLELVHLYLNLSEQYEIVDWQVILKESQE